MLAVLGVITVLTAVMAGLIFTITIVSSNNLRGRQVLFHHTTIRTDLVQCSLCVDDTDYFNKHSGIFNQLFITEELVALVVLNYDVIYPVLLLKI